MPDEKEPIPKFAARIKAKYPEYKDINDTLLTQKIVSKYPEYADMVDMSGIETVKKKEPFVSPSSSPSDGLVPLDADLTAFEKNQERYKAVTGIPIDKNDPVGSAKMSILSTVKKPRITSAEGKSSTGVKRPMQLQLNKQQTEGEGITYGEAAKELKKNENWYRYNTNNAVGVISKASGLNRQQMYDPAYDEQIKQSLQQGNATQRLSYEALQDAKKADKVIKGGGTLEDMAVRYAGLEDKQVAQIDEAPGINSQKFGEATKGRFMFDLLDNPAFKQELDKYPQLKSEYKQEAANLAKTYPDFGKMYYGQIVSQEMEKMGLNNGILNVVTKDEFDKVVDKLKADGKITLDEENFIKNNLRGETGLLGLGKQVIGRESISTPGLIENALQGAVTGAESLGKGIAEVTGIYEGVLGGENAAAKRDLELANKQVDVKPEGLWHEVTQTGGKVLGQSLSIGGGGGLIKAIGLAKNPAVALGLSGGIQAYANYAPLARREFPGEPWKQRGFATVMAAIEALTENIFRDDKVVRGLIKDMKPLVKNTIEDFTAKKISAATANSIIEQGLKSTGAFSKAVGQNVGEEFIAGALGQVNQGVFEGRPMNEWLDAEALGDVTLQAIIGSPFIAGLAARADYMKSRGISSKQIYSMARNPGYWLEKMQETAALDKDLEAQLPDKIKNLERAPQLLQELDSHPTLTEKQKAKYLLTDLDSKIREENLSQKTDPILRAADNAQTVMAIHGNDQVKQDILEGKDDGTYEGDISDKELKPIKEDTIPMQDQSGGAAENVVPSTLNVQEISDIKEMGGNESDFVSARTVFKKPFDDKNLPNVESQLVKEYINNEENVKQEKVSLSDLTPTQRVLDKDMVESGETNEGRPLIIKDKDGRLLVVDGHHRIAIDTKKGLNEMDADVVDISKLDYETYEQTSPTNETKAEDTKDTFQAEKTKIIEERDERVLSEGKPDAKIEFLTAKELVDSKDPIGFKNKHSEIKERYKNLKSLLDCLWQKKQKI